MSGREADGVDIVHDLESLPYPFPDESCLVIAASDFIEHINPRLTIDVMNELWRILKTDGQLAISTPYAGSALYWQDPLNCNGFVPGTFFHFDPDYTLYQKYKPLPWKIEKGFPMWYATGAIEALLRKRERNA